MLKVRIGISNEDDDFCSSYATGFSRRLTHFRIGVGFSRAEHDSAVAKDKMSVCDGPIRARHDKAFTKPKHST